MRTVLFFAYACAPYNRPESTIGAQRPAQFAKFLPRFGWRAIVLCADARAAGPPTHGEIEERVSTALRGADPDSSVIIPLPPMRSDGALDAVWRRIAERQGAVWSVVRRPLTVAKFLSGDYSQNWQPSARRAAGIVSSRTRIDACVGEHSPDAGLFLARWFAERYRVPWIADFRDPFLIGQRAALRPFLTPFARRLVSSASHVVQVTPSFVDIDSRMLGRQLVLIENGFDPDEFEGTVDAPAESGFTIALTGSIWVPSDLERFFQGLALLRDRLGTHGEGLRFRYVGGDHAIVTELAQRVGVYQLADIQGRVPRHVAVGLMRSADVLLVISPKNHPDPYWATGNYTGKVFEYLGARRPILAVPADSGPLDSLLRRTRAGVSATTPVEIATFLETAWRQWRATGAVAYAGDEAVIGEYSRLRAAEKLATLLDSMTARQAEGRAA